MAKRWINIKPGGDTSSFSPDDVAGWEAGQYQAFLETLSSSAFSSSENLHALGRIYGLTGSKNSEILFRYYSLALKVSLASEYQHVADFLGTVGRMKFVRRMSFYLPKTFKHQTDGDLALFRGLFQADKALARQTFERVKDGLHPICREMVRKDLKMA